MNTFVMRMRIVAVFALLVCGVGHGLAAEEPNPVVKSDVAPTPEQIAFFENKIRPLLADQCYSCHSTSSVTSSGLLLDGRRAAMQGGRRGPAIVPGRPEASLLLKAVRREAGVPAMPKGEKLQESQIADLERWIAEGAVWPTPFSHTDPEEVPEHYQDLIESHWAWQPLAEPTVPANQNSTWGNGEIDRFILQKLDEKKRSPSKAATKIDLIRRTTFDLTGLPPTPEAVKAFLADPRDDAFARLVDQLLESPAYGEHWGRHWLDVARYGESTGSARNLPYAHAWRYRDYVINSFRMDKPYDQFIREQIAGDLLPHESPAQREEFLVATGFLALGVRNVNQVTKNRFVLDNIAEQIDTFSQAVLGLTVSCSRCHDHKFDPIPTSDYYALVGIFQSSELCAGVTFKTNLGPFDYYDHRSLIPLGPEEQYRTDPKAVAELEEQLVKAKGELRRLATIPEGKELLANGQPKQRAARELRDQLQVELAGLADLAMRGPVALGVREAKTIADAEIRVRGGDHNYGPVVPRGFLSLLKLTDVPAISPESSGRLELALWLTHADNPLTSRVAVNRIWSRLFGAGLVKSVDNFGVNGDSPSHPELLDYLALRFVEQGWSTKSLIRKLMLTSTYQQSAATDEAALKIDPENRWHWRHSPRRLTAEEIRDAMLLTSGQLNPHPPQASPVAGIKMAQLRIEDAGVRQIVEQGRQSRDRSVYLPLIRGLVPTSLAVFDFADQGMVTGQRYETTVAPQALYMLNDEFVRKQSDALAVDLLQRVTNRSDRIPSAYRTILGREPTTIEQSRADQFLTEIVTLLANPAAPVPSLNADQAEQKVTPIDMEAAAWASFIQALYGSAEFRFLK